MHPKAKDQLITDFLEVTQQYYNFSANDSVDDTHLRKRLLRLLDRAETSDQEIESKVVSILLSDLRGFTSMAENYSALEVMEVLNRYFISMSEVINKYGGVIDKYMGDSIMVLFGAPDTREDDLERTIACAIEMQLAMEEINKTNEVLGLPALFMGIGINTGKVVAGNVGSDLHREYTVIGNEVNLVSRIEAHSLRGQVLISENTYALAKDYIIIGDINNVFVKGKREKVTLYELLATQSPEQMVLPCRELRSSPRVNVDMPLEYQRMNGKSVHPELLRGRIMDISHSGMFAIINEYIPLLSEIKISLSLSLLSNDRMDIYARVIRLNEMDGQYESHFEFGSMEPEGNKAIKDFVARILEGA